MSNAVTIRLSREEGSLPLVLLASIMVAGIIAALFASMLGNERAVRFDRDFAESLQVADVGVNRGLFALNEGAAPPASSAAVTEIVDGIEYTWYGTQSPTSPREWEIVSQSTTTAGVSRRVVAQIEEEPLFFPGAFGDKLVGLNGASSTIDSYNSTPSCSLGASLCGWGTDSTFGTRNGSIGTNETFDFSGNIEVRPNGAFLYDFENNPPQGASDSDPFGDRCDAGGSVNQSRCTDTYIETVPHKLDLTTANRMGFIRAKFDSGGACASAPRNPGTWTPPNPLSSYASTQPANTVDTSISDATNLNFENFYCADRVVFPSQVRLASTVTVDNPVVIFVRDSVQIPDSNSSIAACFSATTGNRVNCDGNSNNATTRQFAPRAARLQIYVLGESASGNNVSIKSGSTFAGVIYAPLSRCGGSSGNNSGGSGGANIDIYGAIICKFMDNVGGWRFHYDDSLGTAGSGAFSVAFWREDTPG